MSNADCVRKSAMLETCRDFERVADVSTFVTKTREASRACSKLPPSSTLRAASAGLCNHALTPPVEAFRGCQIEVVLPLMDFEQSFHDMRQIARAFCLRCGCLFVQTDGAEVSYSIAHPVDAESFEWRRGCRHEARPLEFFGQGSKKERAALERL
jgi:hypothetical protein